MSGLCVFGTMLPVQLALRSDRLTEVVPVALVLCYGFERVDFSGLPQCDAGHFDLTFASVFFFAILKHGARRSCEIHLASEGEGIHAKGESQLLGGCILER